jgi:hypothetical protein
MNLKNLFINAITAAVLFFFITLIFFAAGISPEASISIAGVLLVMSRFISVPKGSLVAGVYRETWKDVVVQQSTALEKATFLESGFIDLSSEVSNVGSESQAIHLVGYSDLPEVLINNTTYPIPTQEITGADILVELDKYQTKVTPISDDSLYALSHKKIGLVTQFHSQAIVRTKVQKAIHALCPGAETAKMKVLEASGTVDSTGRKRLTWNDVIDLRAWVLSQGLTGCRLVFSAEHIADLCREDQKFKDQYYNRANGVVFNQLDFEIFDYAGNPFVHTTNKTKLAFGAIPTANHRRASVMFCPQQTAKANGWYKVYLDEPTAATQRSEFSARHHFIVLPTGEQARAAII